ncbi:MAG: tRNA epoxyqueuosine(34) reductase QueG [Bacteroidota bacterium]
MEICLLGVCGLNGELLAQVMAGFLRICYFANQIKITIQTNKQIVQGIAQRLGFQFIGIAKAEFMEPEARRLEEWLNRGYHGKMQWMENHFDKRVDPTKLVPGAKTVITLLYNYFPADEGPSQEAPKLARYAYGQDYHHVIKAKLRDFIEAIETAIGSVEGRAFVDSAPVLERDWAKRSGTGWVGKNTLLINPKAGSYFFLAELIIDLELEPDGPMKDYCGTCTRCIDACPTDAISPQGYILDGSKCISYLTIELKEAIPDAFKEQMEGWAFGCDICQEVCPWNRFSKPHQEPAFQPHPDLPAMEAKDWREMTEEVFRTVFRKSAVKRAKYVGLKRNIDFLP